MSAVWITGTIVLAAAVIVYLIRRHARFRGVCPECGRTLRTGAVKCLACGMWLAGSSS
jgi:ribosomal protein S27E